MCLKFWQEWVLLYLCLCPQTHIIMHLKNMKWIGPFRFSGVCSDNTGNTRKGLGLTVTKWPKNLDLLDVCHLLSNTGKYICCLPKFKEVSHLYPMSNFCLIWIQPITEMWSILAFLSKSEYTREHLDAQHAKLKIGCRIESISETQFATVYWTAASVQHGLPAFTAIVENQDLGIDLHISISDHPTLSLHITCITSRAKKKSSQRGPMMPACFVLHWQKITTVLGPVAKAIQCLESAHATCADVLLFFLVIVAPLD